MRLLHDAEPGEIATPPMYGVFDILDVNGGALRALPLRERRAILEHELGAPGLLFPVRRLAANGLDAWAEVQRRGLERVVAKPEAPRVRAELTFSELVKGRLRDPVFRGIVAR